MNVIKLSSASSVLMNLCTLLYAVPSSASIKPVLSRGRQEVSRMTLTTWGIITVIFVVIANSGVMISRKILNREKLRAHHEVTDPLLAVVGTLFAVLLGFMVANAMTRFEESRQTVQEESGAVGDVFRLAHVTAGADGREIMKTCVSYAEVVVNDEWPKMDHREMSDKAWNVYGDLWQQCGHLNPQTQAESNIHQAILSSVMRLGEKRRERMAQISYALPAEMWVVVAIGAASTVMFTFFFAIDSAKAQMAMTSLLTIVLALNVFLLASFDKPFEGDIKVKSIPFEANLKVFKAVMNKDWH